MVSAFFWGLLAASSLVLGGLLASWVPLGKRTLGVILAFGAGVLLSATAYELVFEAVTLAKGSGFPALGFFGGAATFFIADQLIDRLGDGQANTDSAAAQSTLVVPLVLGATLDGIPESVVIGFPSLVDPKTGNYDGWGTLSDRAHKVVAVLTIDASSVPHFDPDARQNAQGELTLPPSAPYSGAKAGGIGTGTLWFALGEDGRVIQRRIGPHDKYTEVVIGAGRMKNVISLGPEVLDDEGNLVVEIFDNSPSQFAGDSYGRIPIDVTGQGGIRLVGGGRLTLNGRSDFSGGVTVDSGELVADSESALGTGDVDIRGGELTLSRAALGDAANLRLSDTLQDGTIHLGFSGRDIIHSLQIGDAVHRCGTWGSPDSGAMFTDSLFSGAGILQLAAEPIEGCTTNRTN